MSYPSRKNERGETLLSLSGWMEPNTQAWRTEIAEARRTGHADSGSDPVRRQSPLLAGLARQAPAISRATSTSANPTASGPSLADLLRNRAAAPARGSKISAPAAPETVHPMPVRDELPRSMRPVRTSAGKAASMGKNEAIEETGPTTRAPSRPERGLVGTIAGLLKRRHQPEQPKAVQDAPQVGPLRRKPEPSPPSAPAVAAAPDLQVERRIARREISATPQPARHVPMQASPAAQPAVPTAQPVFSTAQPHPQPIEFYAHLRQMPPPAHAYPDAAMSTAPAFHPAMHAPSMPGMPMPGMPMPGMPMPGIPVPASAHFYWPQPAVPAPWPYAPQAAWAPVHPMQAPPPHAAPLPPAPVTAPPMPAAAGSSPETPIAESEPDQLIAEIDGVREQLRSFGEALRTLHETRAARRIG